MFPVDSFWRASQRRNNLPFHCSQIPRVNDVRLQASECSKEIEIKAKILPLTLVERHDFNIFSIDSLSELRVTFKADDCVPITFRWNMVDQIHQTVLQPSNPQVMNHMDNQRRLACNLPDLYVILPAASDPLHS